LPYICTHQFDANSILLAAQQALETLTPTILKHLGLHQIVKIPKNDYLRILTPSSPCNLFELP
jgi:hypothetical protein